MYVCIFIKLHITAQSGLGILVILCHSRVCMYVCMYVCIFIKLHITAQSGPVILVVLCHSHCMFVCIYGYTYSKTINQPGKVANPARGELNKGNQYFPARVRA